MHFTHDRPAKVAERVKALMGVEDGRQATLTFPDGTTFRNVARFLEEDLPKLPRHPGEAHLVSIQHGDLNAGNILVDDHRNLWIIDFSVRSPCAPSIPACALIAHTTHNTHDTHNTHNTHDTRRNTHNTQHTQHTRHTCTHDSTRDRGMC
jgi:thiamine kinase-like enzyme